MKLKRRSAESIWESLFGTVLFCIAALVVATAVGMNAQAQTSVQTQYDMLAVNAFVSDVYSKYKAGAELSVSNQGEDTSGHSSFLATFVDKDGKSEDLGYDSNTMWVTLDNKKVFKANSLVFSESGQSLYMAIKLKEQHVIELEVYR